MNELLQEILRSNSHVLIAFLGACSEKDYNELIPTLKFSEDEVRFINAHANLLVSPKNGERLYSMGGFPFRIYKS